MSYTDTTGAAVVVAEGSAANGSVSYIDWPAIFAGVVLASAISLILLTFGSAIGLSMTSAREGQSASMFWIAIVGGLWILWVQLMASLAGGYLTGRMRRRTGTATESESDIRDGSNGLVMWGLSSLVAAFIAFSGLTGAANVAGNVAGGVAQAAADVVDPNALLVDRALRGGSDVTDADRAELGRFLAGVVADGEVNADDRAYLVSTIARRTGVSPEEAEQRLDQLVASAQQMEEEARAAAERARKASIVAAFLTAAALAVGAAAAYYAATIGGNHRDEETVFEGWYRPW